MPVVLGNGASKSWQAAWDLASVVESISIEDNGAPTHTMWGEVEPISQSSLTPNSIDGEDPMLGNLSRYAKARHQSHRHGHAIQFLSESLESSANTELDDEVFSEKCSIPVPPEPDSMAWDGESSNKEEDEVSECNANPIDTEVNSMMQHDNDQEEHFVQLQQQLLEHQQAVAESVAKLSPEEEKELKSKMPLDEHGEMTSVGSCGHQEGYCRPCLFQHTKAGCQNGILCDFCHLPHNRKNKPRPCKGKRERYRKLVDRMVQAADSCPRQSCSASNVQVGQGNQEFKAKVLSKLMQHMKKLQAKAGENVSYSIDENTKAQEVPSSSKGIDGNMTSRSQKPGRISL